MRLLMLPCLVSLLMYAHVYAAPLIVGTMPYAPPFESMVQTNKDLFFMGFDIDIMTEVCKRIQTPCEYKPFVYQYLFYEIAVKNIDAAIASIVITPERRNRYLFSLPYLQSKAQVLTISASPLHQMSDLSGKRIGAEMGTLFIPLAKKTFRTASIIEYKSQSELYEAVANHDVDAAILDHAAAVYWVSSNENLFKLLGDSIPIGMGYGIMTSKGNSVLIDRINKALVDMESDGTYLAIYNKYF